MKTSTVKAAASQWVLIDAEGQSLGRLAALAASRLRGKHCPSFSPHLLCGDNVIVINTNKLGLHPTKLHRKTYARHTGPVGHLKVATLKEMMERDSTKVVHLAVRGMLPANRLRKQMLKRLHIFRDAEHPHEAQKPVPLAL